MTRVSINAGLLQMIRNGLERDAAEGKTIRAEWLEEIERDAKPISEQSADTARIDWLADTNNEIGQVLLPAACVTENVHSLRDAIDAAMAMDHTT